MRADDPRHGTAAGSGAHYRDGEKPCDPCREARRRYYRRYHKQRRQGYVRRIRTGHGGVWEQIDQLHRHGYSFDRLADTLGCIGGAHLYVIHNSGPDGEIRVSTWRRLAEALANVRPTPTQIGTVRRLQALHRLGWTINAVMDAAGVGREVGKRALRGQHTAFKAPTMQAIAETYERLSMTLPPPSAGTSRARARAERMGWAPPLAWDDIDRDEAPVGHAAERIAAEPDPSVVARLLAGDHVPHSKADRWEVIRRWEGSDNELERRFGWNVSRDRRQMRGQVAA